MNTTENLFVILPEGGIQRWTTTKQDIEIGEQLAEEFSGNLLRSLPRMLPPAGDYGPVGVTLGKNHSFWAAQVLTLNLQCPFNNESGILVPVFDSKEAPVLTLAWKVPEAIKLYLGITAQPYGGQYFGQSDGQYLTAVDSEKRMWRLPLSNLYAPSRLCHGMDKKYHPTALGVLMQATEQFSKSPWTSHLYSDANASTRASTKLMFRFRLKDDGFEQLPVEGDWTARCARVSEEFLIQNLLPLV